MVSGQISITYKMINHATKHLIRLNGYMGNNNQNFSSILVKVLSYFDNAKDSEDLITGLHLSSKQYYSRIQALMRAGLIKRQRSKYYLTCLGKITYNSYTSIQHAVDYNV